MSLRQLQARVARVMLGEGPQELQSELQSELHQVVKPVPWQAVGVVRMCQGQRQAWMARVMLGEGQQLLQPELQPRDAWVRARRTPQPRNYRWRSGRKSQGAYVQVTFQRSTWQLACTPSRRTIAGGGAGTEAGTSSTSEAANTGGACGVGTWMGTSGAGVTGMVIGTACAEGTVTPGTIAAGGSRGRGDWTRPASPVQVTRDGQGGRHKARCNDRGCSDVQSCS